MIEEEEKKSKFGRNMLQNMLQLLFTDQKNEYMLSNIESGAEITLTEIERAIQKAKNKKACGPDEIPAELLKILQTNGKQYLLQMFNNIYETGDIPEDWLKSTFITLPEKSNAKKCSDYRTISLMSHTLKIFLRIIHNRIYDKLERNISNTQFGFRNNLGTREALFSI